jgi:hypothetical protein
VLCTFMYVVVSPVCGEPGDLGQDDNINTQEGGVSTS